jgi:uncharacterized repeat protein (TIGR01451 family)
MGDVQDSENAVAHAARPRSTTQGCGGDDADDVPNNVYGWGIVDALAAIRETRVGLSVGVRPHPVAAGGSISHTVRITNIGTDTLGGVVTHVLPAEIVPVGSVTRTISGLSPGNVWAEALVADVEAGYEGPLESVVRFSGDDGEKAVYTTTAEAVLPRVEVSKYAPSFLQNGGSALTYTLRVSNVGMVPVSQVVLTDTLPTSTTLAAATGSHELEGCEVSWLLGSLAPRESRTVSLTVDIGELLPGATIVNAEYGVRARELVTPARGTPVVAQILWRLLLPTVLRDVPAEEG